MKELRVVTYAPDQTRELGKKLGSLIDGSFLITLSGELGAGKTTFTQGLARGLEITRNVTSPTFTLMKSYKGRLPLYHIDAYRLEDIDQDLGFEEYVDGDGVCVIEWSNFIEDVLPEERLSINLTISDDDSRMLVFSAYGDKYEEVLERLCTQ
ncbi:MAG: tRNA (adenosine(37)-N6)-threonylcarbamoyltransferase complex ATPase subunit type 1 TsaE [Erysipelotrichaceae bacterium]|nr:tRNA (adenosine(37)-N6)-threonylcarbamoyltransferase complex ATPase subunit type 1 TsaE [Erysipelotrichaceae bacterium]